MSRYVITIIAVFAIVLGLLFSFSSSYSSCAERQTDLTRMRARLQRECDLYAELTPRIAALTLRYAQQHNGLVQTAELASARLVEHRSPADMARAHKYLQRALQQMVDTLDEHRRAAKLPAYMDVRAAFVEQTRKVTIAVEQYNDAALALNAALTHPLAMLWKDVMGFQMAELFDARTSNTVARTAAAVRPRATSNAVTRARAPRRAPGGSG